MANNSLINRLTLKLTTRFTVRTTCLSGYGRCSTFCEHPSHEKRGTRLCTADNQSLPQIQATHALICNGCWRTNFRWPCRHGILSSAISEVDLRKNRLLAPQSIIKEGPAPNFQIMVAKGQLETPKSTVEMKFEVADMDFHEIFIVMQKITSPLIGLSFLQGSKTILDMKQGVLNFPFLSKQLKTADHKYTNVM